MTDHRDARDPAASERADAALDVRAALERTVAHLVTASDLVPAVNRRAHRIRQRRVAVGTGIVAAVTALVVLGVGSVVASTKRHTEPPLDIRPVVSTTLSAPATSAAPTAVTGSPSSTAGRANASSPVAEWGPVRTADEFTGTALNRSLWTIVYGGPAAHPLGAWSPSDVAVGDGALRLSISRPAGVRPPSTSGAVGARASAQRYGRWEVRWRMTPGRGVLGQFTLNPDAGGAPAIVLNLTPATGTIEVTGAGVGAAAGATATVARADEYHTVAVEWAPQHLRFLVDGRVFAESATGVPAAALWPALQAFLAGPDCGATPLPEGCGATRTPFPQRLDVDRFHVQPYRG